MILKLPKLETERLVLRPFTLEDATLVQKYAGDKRIYQTTSNIPHPYENGMAEWWISTHATTFFEKKGVVLALTLKENGELIGAIGLHADTENKRAELGYWIAPEYWGKGFCTESAGVLIKYGFEVLEYHRIYACYFKENKASGRVMEKIGMKKEGELVDHIYKDGKFHTAVYYGIINPA